MAHPARKLDSDLGVNPLAAYLAANPGVSMRKLAERVGVQRQYLGQVARDEVSPSYRVAYSLEVETCEAVRREHWHDRWMRAGKRGPRAKRRRANGARAVG